MYLQSGRCEPRGLRRARRAVRAALHVCVSQAQGAPAVRHARRPLEHPRAVLRVPRRRLAEAVAAAELALLLLDLGEHLGRAQAHAALLLLLVEPHELVLDLVAPAQPVSYTHLRAHET